MTQVKKEITYTNAVSVAVNGMVLPRWSNVSIDRDLTEIAGSFVLSLRDDVRSLASWPYGTPGMIGPMILGQQATISVYGRPVLVGWVETVEPIMSEDEASLTISGRDLTGDLVDCTAAPEGPVEFRKLRLEEFAERLCKPFGVAVKCDVDTSPVFDKMSLAVSETVLSAIEKYARERGVLVTSDGVEGLVLTRSGSTRAASDITAPSFGVLETRGQFSTVDRFSDYYVKGQTEKAAGARAKSAPMTPGTTPAERVRDYLADSGGSDGKSKAGGKEASGVTVLGHARDTEVTRYRPIVAQMKAGGNADSAQRQADWMARVHRARGDQLTIPLTGWIWGSDVWRPNSLTHVTDRFQMVSRDYLVGGVSMYLDEDGGEVVDLRLVGPEAYDPEETDAGS